MTEVAHEMAVDKIHRAVVIDADLYYVDSIAVDEDLLGATSIVPGRKISIVDVNGGERLSACMIAGERSSGTIQLSGAATHEVSVGGLVIVIAYVQVPESLVCTIKLSVVFVDGANMIVSVDNHVGSVPEGSPRTREPGLKSPGV